jgi:hypothetical protein
MPYTPPSLTTLIASTSRDLRDPANKVFSTQEVTDFINWGLVECNRAYPLAQVETVDITDLITPDKADRVYVVASREIYRVEVYTDGEFREQVPEGVDYSNTGWDLFGSTLTLPTWLLLDPARDTVKVYGYLDRETLSAGGDIAETDAEAEMGLRLYATLTGYQRLQNDRAQFQQWLALPGNNDISATQLDGMANTYLGQWNRHRNQMRRLRR